MKSKTDWAHLKSGKAKASDEHPEADIRRIVRGVVRKGLQPAPPKASVFIGG